MAQDIPGTNILTNGPYQIPSPKEKGNDIADIIEGFFERMANHSHTGADSKSISLNFTKEVQSLLIGTNLSWVAQSNGSYRAQVTLPVVATNDNMRRFFYEDGGNYIEFFPTQEPIDATNYYIFSNDNTINVRVVYF
jgi:hypothetical protein